MTSNEIELFEKLLRKKRMLVKFTKYCSIPYAKHVEVSSAEMVIRSAFLWVRTDQGMDKWNSIHEAWLKVLSAGKL
mgnify:CR=1 FL=1